MNPLEINMLAHAYREFFGTKKKQRENKSEKQKRLHDSIKIIIIGNELMPDTVP